MNLRQLRFILAAYDVKRYHTWPVHRIQTIGDHSARVAMILCYLQDGETEGLADALLHDIAEKITGDIPATAKWMFPALAIAIDEAEEQVHRTEGLMYVTSETLRAADTLDLILFAWEELKFGNRNGEELIRRGRKFLHSLDMPPRIRERVMALLKEIPHGSE